MKKLIFLASLLAAGCGGTLPAQPPIDAAMLVSTGGPVTSPNGGPVSCRIWNCTCQCVKGCLQ